MILEKGKHPQCYWVNVGFNIFQTPEAVATILFATVNSQVKKTIDLVFFCIFVFPTSSWPNLTVEINFNSNEMVTHGLPSATLCAAVPTPEST